MEKFNDLFRDTATPYLANHLPVFGAFSDDKSATMPIDDCHQVIIIFIYRI